MHIEYNPRLANAPADAIGIGRRRLTEAAQRTYRISSGGTGATNGKGAFVFA